MVEQPDDLTGFRDVDGSASPCTLAACMNLVAEGPAMQRTKDESIALMGLARGGTALDLGCGPGFDVLRMAAIVGTAGRAIGVDASETMLDEARRGAAAAGVAAEFQYGRGEQLPFPDETFDACHVERVLCHVEDPGAVLAELVRVTRPGGRLVLVEGDYDSLALDLPDQAMVRRVREYMSDRGLRHGLIGRQLPRLVKRAGLIDIAIEPLPSVMWGDRGPLALAHGTMTDRAVAAGALSADETAQYHAAVAAAEAEGVYCQFMLRIRVSGTKPPRAS